MPDNMPVLGTTATANDRVIEDIQTQLGDFQLIRGPLSRHSLHLQNIVLTDQASRLVWLVSNLPKIPGTGIIYTLTKRDAENVAKWLVKNGIDAKPYYSGATHDDFEDSNDYRQYLEESLLNNEIKALVATTALSMGYDKPDLAFVIHYQAPGSIVGYYQQVGRAGRGIDTAYGILLSGREDADIHDFFHRSAFPPRERIDDILGELEEAEHGLSEPELVKKLNYKQGQISHCLKYLSVENPAPVFKEISKWSRTPVEFELDYEKIAYLTAQRQQEWHEVQDYLSHTDCLMVYLQNSLDDPTATPCGRCANCLEKDLLDNEINDEIGQQAALFLRHSEFPLRLKRQIPRGALPHYGWSWNLPHNLRGEEGRVLSRWRDAGWGNIVARDKANNYFQDALVDAMAEMILERWNPEPFPTWLTCVPSTKHPELVPSFAERLASKLNLPFHPIITKVSENSPQKNQENSYFQCHNLDGVFEIEGDMPEGPVFLVDDAVDSGWTLTILSALLRSRGSGPVFPLALSSTSFSN